MPLLSDEEFAKVHGAIEAQRAQSQAATLLDGLRTQSQAAARAVQVGKTLDLPPGFVLADPEQNELLAKAKNLRDATDASPVLKNWMASHPLNTSLAQNDVGTLGQMESTLAPKSIGQSLLDAPMEIIKGLGGSFNKAATGVNMAAGAFPAMYGYITGNTDAADWWFKNMVDPGVQKQQVFAPDANARFAEKAGNMAGGVLGMLSQATLSGTTAAPGAALTPTATAAQAVSGAVEQGTKAMLFPALSDALDTGRRVYTETNDAAAAVKAAQAQYISSTAMGVFPMAVPGSLGVRAASGFAVGAATGEVARQYMNASMPEGMQTPFDIEELMLSGLAGSIFGAVGHHDEAGYHKQIRQGMLELRRARVAEEAGAVLDKASQLATASELRTNAPDHFKEVARMMTEDGAIKDVYVEADHLAQSMDKAGITAEELRTILPEVAEQMKMGLETQGLVRIPTADYLTHIAGGKLDPLLREELRYNDPNGMTLKQAKEWQGGEAERMKEMAASLVKDETERSAFKASQQAVQDKIHADLNATGKFSTDVNRVKATITAAIISRIAALEKVTPEAAWEKYGSTVRNGALMGGGELDQSPLDRRMALRELHKEEGVTFTDSGIDRGGAHSPAGPDSGSPAYDVALNGTYPEDFYGANGLRYYGTDYDKLDAEVYNHLRRLAGRPNHPITVYRAVEKDGAKKISPGDWVTPSRAYAKDHGESALNGNYKILKMDVKARDIWTAGDSMLEWGYHPQPFLPEVRRSAEDGNLAQQPFSGPEKATTPLPQGTTHIDVDGVQRPATNSNGQPIHWSEEGVRNFWRWFGDSKVVDAEGRPMVVYHGTPWQNITEFNTKDFGALLGKGAYFTADPTEAAEYAGKTNVVGSRPNIIPAYVSLRDPAFVDSTLVKVKQSELASAGRDGIILRDADGGVRWAVAFDPTQIKSATGNNGDFSRNDGSILRQGETAQKGPTVNATYSPSTRTISLLQTANLTSYLHETGHWALDTYARIAASPEAPAAIREDMGKVLEWFGIKGTDLGVDPVATLKALTPEHTYTPEELQALDKAVRSEVSPRNAAKGLAKDIGGVDEQTLARIVDDLRKTGNASDPLEVWNAMSLDEQRPYHEKFARGFETYLMEGKAPSQALQPFFARIKQWMIDAYKSITSLGVTLTPEVRGVFDRMLASEQEIAQAKAARVFEPFAVEKPAGVSAEDWANYTSMDAKADADAVATLQARSVRDMKWLSGAKSRALRDIQKQAEAARKEVRAEVEAQVNDEPVYRMQDWLKANRITKDNIDPDMLADMFGFSSGDEAMRALAEAQPKAEVIEGMTDRRMLEEHGELSTPDAIERAANEAVHNEARARFMATGLKMLANSPISATVLRKGAREAARAAVGNTRVRDLNPNQFLAAEAKANAEVLKLAAKDTEGAVRAQRSALLNNQLVAEAYKAQERVQKALDHFKKLGGETAQGNMRGEMLDQLNALLARFDLRTSINPDKERVPLGEWVKAEAERLSAVMPDLPEWVTNDLYKTSYKNLTVDEMLGLFDSVRQLEHMARREQKQYMAVRAMEFAAERGAVLAEIRKHWAKAFDKDTGEPLGLEPDFVPSIKKAVSKMGDKFSGEFLSPETILSILGGGDFTVVNESLFSRLSNRSDWKAERLSGIYKELKPLFDQYSMKEKFDFGRKDITTPAGLPTPMTRENALMVALLHGNPEGRQRLENYGLGEARQRQIIELLDERDAKLANAIWKLFDTNLWPELEALNQRTRGKAPPKVEALPYTTNAGEWTGGYMRLKYDTNLEERAHRLDEGQAVKELLGGGLGMSSKTNQGTSTERKQNVTLRPRLTLDVFAEAVNETVHDLAYREAVADTMRMLNDKGIQNAVKQVVGTEGYRALVGRVREVAAPPRNPSGFVENAISIARHNTVINLMSGVKTALQNLTGLAPALAEVNAGTLGAEVAKFYGPGMAERTRFAMEQSAFMRNRFDHYDRDLQTNIKKLSVKGSLRPDDSTFLALMGFVDRGVTVPLWNAAFKQGMERFANDQPKAVEYADHIVRQTQGSGRDVDLAQIMSGHGGWGQLKKAFTMFYSYFNGQLGLITKHAVKTKLDAAEGNTAVEAGKMAAKMMAIVVVPTVLTELLMRGWQIEGEDDEAQKRRWAGAFVKYGAGFFPFVRDIVPGMWAVATGDKYFGTKVSPIDSAAEGVVRATKSAIDVAKGENDEKDTKNLIMGVGYLAGVPGKLVADTVEGTRLWLNGEAGPQAILLGPPPKP